MCVHISLCTAATHNTAQNSSDIFPLILLDMVYSKEKEKKEIYLYSAIYCDTLKALRRGSQSFTCK